jgi:RimJ/RimL family protein N-acetyltransferase
VLEVNAFTVHNLNEDHVVRAGRVLEEFEAGGRRVVFRHPRADDLEAFIKMHRTLTEERVMARRLELDPTSGERMLSRILEKLSDDQHSYILVEASDILVGEGFLGASGGHGYCDVGVALVDAVRNLGIGTRLMRLLEEEAHRLGFPRMFLTVWSANPAAMHVYEKVGYRECGRRPDWIKMDSGELCDLIEMHKRAGEE